MSNFRNYNRTKKALINAEQNDETSLDNILIAEYVHR